MKHIISVFILITLFSCTMDPNIFDDNYYTNPATYFDDGDLHPQASEYKELIDKFINKGMPGIAMHVQNSNGTWAGTGGKIDIRSNILWKKSNISRIGSISKIFVSVTTLQLSEQGKVDLDLPISHYLSVSDILDIQNAEIVTVRQLLNHTSGIVNYNDNLSYLLGLHSLSTPKNYTLDDLLDFVRNMEAYFSPGNGFHYSNTNYVLLGKIIEAVTNNPYQDSIYEQIINPLNLQSTICDPYNIVPDGLARGYEDLFGDGNLQETTYREIPIGPSGGMISNVFDLSVFIQTLIYDRTFLSESLFNEMLAPGYPTIRLFSDYISGIEESYGLGIMKLEYNNNTWIGHAGNILGYSALMLHCVTTNTTVTILVNSNTGMHTWYFIDLVEEILSNVS